MRSAPGDVLVRPIAIGAAVLYGVNDHVVKTYAPGVLSGKLSDVAGMVVLPLTLFALAELATGRLLGRRSLAIAIAIAMIGFTAVEIWPPAADAWCWTWGVLQWPWHAAWAWQDQSPWPPIQPVRAWSDPTDLLTLPCGLLAFLALRHRGPHTPV